MKKVITLIVLIMSLSVFAAPESVRLEYKFDNENYQAFQLVTNTKSEFAMFGIDQSTGSKLILNLHREIEKGDKKDTFKIKNVVDSGRMIIGTKESKYAGEGTETNILMHKSGKILEDLSGKSGVNELQVNFPDKAVRIGDAWGTKMQYDISDISDNTPKLDISVMFVLKGFEYYKGHECAVIESRFDTKDVNERLLKIDVKGNGKIYFAYKEGKLMANFSKLKISFAVKSDQNKENKLRTVFGVKLDLLSQLTSL